MPTTDVMLSPNRGGAIDRVIVIAQSSDPGRVIVLNIDGLAQNSQLLKRFNPSYHYATRMWNAVSSIVLIAGIVLSFLWYWWAFIVGSVAAFAIYRSNRTSVADFAREALASDPNAGNYFASLGLVWEMNAAALVKA